MTLEMHADTQPGEAVKCLHCGKNFTPVADGSTDQCPNCGTIFAINYPEPAPETKPEETKPDA